MADTTTKILEVVVDNNKAIEAIAKYNRLIDEQKARQKELTKQMAEYKKVQEQLNLLKKLASDGRDLTKPEWEQYSRLSVKYLQLRDALKDYDKEMAQSKEITKTYSRQVQELSKEIQNNIKADTEQAGSLRALRAELSNVTKEYDSLSEAERKSAKGLELKAKIQDITTQLKNSEEETGRFYRNVGNYANSFVEAFTRMGGSMGNLQGPINIVKNGFTAISSTPIIAILGALVTIIQKVIQSLKSSEATMNAVTTALAPLNAGSRLLTNVMQALGNGIAKVVEKLTQWADKLGLVTEAMKTEQELTKAEIALQLREREVLQQNADSQLKIAELKAKAAQKDIYTAKERLGFLQDAVKEEDAVAKRELELARERYRIQLEQSKLAENSKEENDALAQSYAAMRQAETDYFNKTKELSAQIVEAKNAMAAENKKAADAAVEAAEKEATALAKSLGLTDEQLEKVLDIKKREIEARLKLVEEGSLEEYRLKQEQLKAEYDIDMQRLEQEEGADELIKLRREQFTKDMTDLEQTWADESQAVADELFQENLANILAEAEARKKAFEEQQEQERAKQQLAEDTALAFGDVAGSIAGMLQAFGEENKELTRLSKVIALAQIAIETGVATARGISAAMTVPFPANLAAIATTITTIMAGITSAISTVKSAKFAGGGYVSGPGTSTSDSIPARLSNGESVINARSTAMFGPLLSSLNQAGGGVSFNPAAGGQREGYEFLAAAVAAGMKSVKLSVGVDEITRVQDRVDTIKQISTIG